MGSTKPAPSNLNPVARTIAKILRFRRPSTISGGGVGGEEFSLDQDDDTHNLKHSKAFEEYPSVLSGKVEEEKQQEASCSDREAMESLLANLFTSISAVKAAYAQLQVSQSPYDPDTIQSADQVVVSELKHLSELKQSYLKKESQPPPVPPLAAHIQEQRNLLKTYQITTRKLESEVQFKDSEILSLQSDLMESDRRNRSLESRLHPGRSQSSLEDLHLSGLDPTHFLAALRQTVKSIRSFVKQLVLEMESAGWDLDAAAGSIQPTAKPDHRTLAFESFVCERMFSGFQHRDFGLSSLEDRVSWSRERFFDEFAKIRSVKHQFLVVRKRDGLSGLRKFLRAKYLSLVHPKMEASFFGDLDQRALFSSGRGFPSSEFFTGFAEMARRVWLLHCLFFSFGAEAEASIFQVRRGCRFSEVYMEEVGPVGAGSTVGFTVVPGFTVGRMLIQCKVYLFGGTADGRS